MSVHSRLQHLTSSRHLLNSLVRPLPRGPLPPPCLAQSPRNPSPQPGSSVPFPSWSLDSGARAAFSSNAGSGGVLPTPGDAGSASEEAARARRMKPTVLQTLWGERYALGNMALLVSCSILALKVSSQKKDLDEAQERWRDSERRLLADLESASAEMDTLRDALLTAVQAGPRNLAARVTSAVEESKKRDRERAALSADVILDSTEEPKPSAPRMFLPGITAAPGTKSPGASEPPSKFMV